ncbi:hydroxymethylglutaryl-CoA lyase [Myxococcus sp. K15C18031901]|uniref:hydroxymethylglutaryl-CoA lyase n=1 Tax=Myxococcus dinghuensis TaxID=2906761 RepID=UPI0020A6FC70|nr:hydroxymethylglutaryl-CoA lyase [Myxococcus dinghuensis]MCP3098807.1 hydroxymethylglutaryl-CoA lyase [Myxococcus dinghuensis]
MSSVRIVEVGPRDGLQNEAVLLPTQKKVELIDRLADAGLREIEATSFVSPQWVPQMADHADVMRRLVRRPGLRYPVLTPNLRGYQTAVASGAAHVAVFTSASESFARKNINSSIEESFARFAPVFEAARADGIPVRGYVSCAIACPYEGRVAPERVAHVARRLVEAGCYEVSLGDTIGVGTPATVMPLLEAVAAVVPLERIAGHFHDTYGMGIANVHAAYEFGVRVFDSSVGGLGGCPYAKGATGNVATEDLVYLLKDRGIDTGVDLDRLVDCAVWISQQLGRPLASRVGRALQCAAA